LAGLRLVPQTWLRLATGREIRLPMAPQTGEFERVHCRVS
jgi:hypothetical protein